MLCSVLLTARTSEGLTVAENFLHYFACAGYPPEREDAGRTLVLRAPPANWSRAEWSGGGGDRGQAKAEDCCYGYGHGFFEWILPLGEADLSKARRIKVLCEASSHRAGAPQTDSEIVPTTLQMFLNDVRICEAVLRNQPHDSRGVLSYLRGGAGGYGYLTHAFAENDLLAEIVKHSSGTQLRLRCTVPANARAQAGLTVYGAECGRFPVAPTVIIEW
jgi:hypothetical protein